MASIKVPGFALKANLALFNLQWSMSVYCYVYPLIEIRNYPLDVWSTGLCGL